MLPDNQPRDIMPAQWFGNSAFPVDWMEMQWLRDLPKDTYYALWLKIPSIQNPWPVLPTGHQLYIVGFMDEPLDHVWLADQCKTIQEPIIVLNDGCMYDFPLPDNVYFFQFHSWHYQLQRIIDWFPQRQPRVPKIKASAICNRITQSKMLIFTAIMNHIGQENSLVKLGDWLEEKNIHHRQPTDHPLLDRLAEEFFEKWFGKKIQVDEWNNKMDNVQAINSNPWNPFYLDAAIHFTNESTHYSLMHDEYGQYIRPGPGLSEKTYKCLVAGTPFISVAQFDVYRSFAELGFQFDYGSIDLSWDQDPGNISRMVKIIELIQQLEMMSVADIVESTKDSTEHNLDHVWSGKFKKICENKNLHTAQEILSKFS